MRCLSCLSPITAANRQVYDKVTPGLARLVGNYGSRIPYCRNCIARKKLKSLDAAQRAAYVLEARDKLIVPKLTRSYTAEDVEDSERQLETIGFTADEIKFIVGGLPRD